MTATSQIQQLVSAMSKIIQHIEKEDAVKMHPMDFKRIYEAITTDGDLYTLEDKINKIIPLVSDLKELYEEGN